MRVIQFIPTLGMGGAETLVKDYALGFDKSKIDLIVLCLYRINVPYEKIMEEKKIDVVYLSDVLPITVRENNQKHSCLIKEIIQYFLSVLFIWKYIRQVKPDVIHIHLSIIKYLRFAFPSNKIRFFYTIHNEPKLIWSQTDKIKRFEFVSTKWFIKKYNMQLIALHDDMRKELNAMFQINNVIVVNNGINFEQFNVSKTKEEIRKLINIPVDAFVIGHIGRFAKQKNHDFLIDIFCEIYSKIDKAYLLLIGDGPEKQNIEKKIREKRLEKHVITLANRTDIPELLYAMDRFVFPSLFEGLSIVLVEAQKMHIPCIVSDNVSNYTILTNLIIKRSLTDSAADWADAVINFDIEGLEIEEKALDEWNMKKICRRLEDVYRGTIQR